MHHHSGAGQLLGGFPIWIIVLAGIILIVLIGIYLNRKTMQSDYLTSKERNTLSDMEIEILKLVRQTGKPMRQSEICDLMPSEPDEVANYLSSLQDKKLIERNWLSVEKDYLVKSI
jgi:predicted MarR family transcription regulator